LLLGERPKQAWPRFPTNTPNPTDTVGLSISHRFATIHIFCFPLSFAYNAARSIQLPGAPDVGDPDKLVRDNQKPSFNNALKKELAAEVS